jgi:hypothetical protein
MEARVKTEISEWIVRAALAGTDEIEIIAGVCQRLNRSGIALVRSSIATNLLDPTIDARFVRWNRGEVAIEEAFPRTDDPASTAAGIVHAGPRVDAWGEGVEAWTAFSCSLDRQDAQIRDFAVVAAARG